MHACDHIPHWSIHIRMCMSIASLSCMCTRACKCDYQPVSWCMHMFLWNVSQACAVTTTLRCAVRTAYTHTLVTYTYCAMHAVERNAMHASVTSCAAAYACSETTTCTSGAPVVYCNVQLATFTHECAHTHDHECAHTLVDQHVYMYIYICMLSTQHTSCINMYTCWGTNPPGGPCFCRHVC